MKNEFPICGLQKTTLLDYPDRVAATIFLGGCNLRCPFCQNGQLVLSPKAYICYTSEEILSFLNKRKGVLSGVCITGGEPTLYSELLLFIKQIKSLGYAVKLDTNGTNPAMLKNLLTEGLLDYIAMDIKSDLEHYKEACAAENVTTLLEQITTSANLIRTCEIPYEFRTTVVKGLHNSSTFLNISHWLSGSKSYFLQNYVESEHVINPVFSAFSKAELQNFLNICKPHFETVSLRGIE